MGLKYTRRKVKPVRRTHKPMLRAFREPTASLFRIKPVQRGCAARGRGSDDVGAFKSQGLARASSKARMEGDTVRVAKLGFDDFPSVHVKAGRAKIDVALDRDVREELAGDRIAEKCPIDRWIADGERSVVLDQRAREKGA